MPSGAVRGKDFKLYVNTDDPYDSSPTWVEVQNVKDLSRTLEKAMADASTRLSDFRAQVGTLKDLTIDFQMVYAQGDAARAVFEDAFYDDANLDCVILDGPMGTVGSAGIRFMAQVTKDGTGEELENVGLVDISLVPGFDLDPTHQPRRVHVASPGSVVNS